VCSFQVIFNLLAINCNTSVTKSGLLSDPIDTGSPNQGMISFNRHLATSWAFLVQVGKAFIHPEKVQTNTSNIRDCFWHRDCTFHILSYLCWRAWGHNNAGPSGLKGCLPCVSSFMELLDKCGSQ
jgi:hypothetical protein